MHIVDRLYDAVEDGSVYNELLLDAAAYIKDRLYDIEKLHLTQRRMVALFESTSNKLMELASSDTST